MIKEHDRVILEEKLLDAGLERGDVGVVVHVYGRNEAYEVEFVELDGATFRVVTLGANKVRPVHSGEIAHVRPLAAA